MSGFNINHPLMGLIQGKTAPTGDSVQFLGIKYGRLADRFAPAEVNHYTPDCTVDATKLGPFPISSAGALHMESGIIQQSLPVLDIPSMNDLECLNLNITVPKLADRSTSSPQRLPVIVYIHGGAFLFGSNWYPHYTQEKFVELASQSGNPVIGVIFNYRLGLPGLLTSKEMREAGYPSNNALLDQKVCLRWLKKYIAGFGGDPDLITVVGQSAGAMSICYHLQSTETLFRQAAILGGSTLLQGPSSTEDAEALYQGVLGALGLANFPPRDRIKALLTTLEDDILAQGGFTSGLNIVADEQVVPGPISVSALLANSDKVLPGKQWCERLFAIQGNLESSVMGFLILAPRKEGIAKLFRDFMRHHFENEIAVNQLLTLYGLTEDTTDDTALVLIMEYLNDVCFYAPACLLASLWPKGYVGNFNEGNPWDGPNRGKANHMLDTALLWQQYNDHLTPRQKSVAEAYACDIAAFAAGSDCLPLFKDNSDLVTWGPSDEGMTRQVVNRNDVASGRKSSFFDIMEALGGLSALLAAYGAFVGKLQAQL